MSSVPTLRSSFPPAVPAAGGTLAERPRGARWRWLAIATGGAILTVVLIQFAPPQDPAAETVVAAREAPADGSGLARARAAAARRARAATAAPPRTDASGRAIVDAKWAPSLFATHSWYVPPPPPPPPKAVPPPPPSAPPLPYSLVGSFTPEGGATVYFVARGDRVLDVHVGDRLDGVYDVEGGPNGQLVFNYLPLSIRQPLPGVSP
jgi:hypothetical protein